MRNRLMDWNRFDELIDEKTRITNKISSLQQYDKMYGRENNVEGFILIQSDREIMKYVRNKNGKITPHTW